jgi:hypothetical protein
LKIGRSIKHFAHPWKNDSTNAGLLKMLLEAYDEKYKNKKNKSMKIRQEYVETIDPIYHLKKEED